MIEIITKSAEETKKTGYELAQTIKQRSFSKDALVIALEGDLGSGKTTFIQGLGEGLGVKENILSPTFVVQKDFQLDLVNYKNLYHIDVYRLKHAGELLDLGFKDLIKNPENIVVIEWADRVKKLLPKKIIWIKFEHLGENKRKIII